MNKPNVFIIDGISKKVIERYYSDKPEEKAKELAKGYWVKGDGALKVRSIPTEKYPNRKGIDTATDFFIHFLA